MKRAQVVAQLYTTREHCRTEADFAASMRRIRAIGYQAVQISGVGPIPEASLKRICDGEGLVIAATHEPGKVICEEPQKVIDRLGALGCRYTAYPHPHVPLRDLAEVEALARQLDASGAALRQAGMTLCYHNHHREFIRVAGRPVLEWLYDLTAPANLQGEIDTYWVQTGGGDPVAWCRRLAGRQPLIHFKDYAVTEEPGADGKPAIRTGMADIGAGSLDWPAIAAAAEAGGCRWYIVEHDCPVDAFASLATSFAYITDRLCED